MRPFFNNIVHIFGDATDKDQTLDPLHHESDIPALIDGLNQTIFQINRKGQWIYLNYEWEKLTGFSITEALHTDYIDYVHPDDREQSKIFIDNVYKNNPQSSSIRIRFLTKDESLCWVNMRTNNFLNSKDNEIYLVGVLSNITDRVREYGLHQANYRTLSTLINNLCGLVYRGRNDHDWTMEFISDGCMELTGYQPSDMINKTVTFGSLINPDDRDLVWANVQSALTEYRPYEMNYRIRTRNGEERWVWERGKGNFSGSGELLSIEGLIIDVTDYKRNNIRDIENILYKTKTKLPQKYLFLDRLDAAVTRSNTVKGYKFALLIIHIDRFNKLQNRYSADFIEQVILNVCERLNITIKPTDSLCLFEDGEFEILLEHIDTVNSAIKIIKNIFRELQAPILINDIETYLTVSIGVTVSSNNIKDRDATIHETRTALSRANSLGGSRYEIFDEKINSRMNSLDRMENEIRYALQNDELLLCYQPIVSLKNGAITGIETQLFWNHPRRGKIPAKAFSPIEADDEIVFQLNQWITSTIVNQMKLWEIRSDVKQDLFLIIQFYGEKIFTDGFEDKIKNITLNGSFNNSKLLIKIPVNTIQSLTDSYINVLEIANKQNIKFVATMDGPDLPPIEILKNSAVNFVHLSHLTDLEFNNDLAYAKAQIDFIRALGKHLIASEIDSKEHIEILQSLGCDYAMGDAISSPLESQALLDFITENSHYLQ